MPLESVNYIKDLNAAYPDPDDGQNEGDDHIRNIKKALRQTFPQLGGAVTRTHLQLSKAPYDQPTMEALLGTNVRLATVKGFAGVQNPPPEIAFGWDSAARRLKAFVGGTILTEALAFLSDSASGVQLSPTVISFGNGLQLRRYTYYDYPSLAGRTIAFDPAFAETPFLILPISYTQTDGAAAYGGGIPNQSSYGSPVQVASRTATSCQVRVTGEAVIGTRYSVYVLGRVG